MRVYLLTVRAGGGAWDRARLQVELRQRGVYPDGALAADLERLADAGLIERVATGGTTRERWAITDAGEAFLDQVADGGPDVPSPERSGGEPSKASPGGRRPGSVVTGPWRRVGARNYSSSCHPATVPGWYVWLDEPPVGGVAALLLAAVDPLVHRRSLGVPWVVTVRRARRWRLRRALVFRAEFDDPAEASARAADLDRQLLRGHLPPGAA